jgi:hypothetical protein
MAQKKTCCICDEQIPKKSVDQLIELGYSHMEFKKETANGKKSAGSLYFCPKHSFEERMTVINFALAGKTKKDRFSNIVE